MSKPYSRCVTSILIACILFFSFVAVIAQTRPVQHSESPHTAQQRYVDAAHHFSLVVPEGWIHAQHGMSTVFAGPKDGASYPNFVVTLTMATSASDPTLAQYMDDARQAISKLKTITIVSETATTLDGRPARAMLVQGTARGVNIVQRQVYCLRGRQGFVLGATTSPQQSAKYNSTFDRIFSNFKWEK